MMLMVARILRAIFFENMKKGIPYFEIKIVF